MREREVLALICSGLTNRRIADTLSISTTTAERHVHNILTKLCCANRAEAAAIATRLTQAPTNGHAPPANGNSALQSAMAPKRPVVRFLQAGDGAPLAWTSIGSGPPVVLVPNFPFCHVSLIDQLLPDWFESMSARATLTWYDSRGCGLSQRESADFRLERQVEDLHAVLASLPLTQPPVLCCLGNGSPVGIRYAALYPNALSHLVIIDGWATAADLRGMTSQRVADALSGVEWKTYTEVIAGLSKGYGAGDEVVRYASFIRECVSPEGNQAAESAMSRYDVTEDLPNVRASTLVLHSPAHRWRPPSAGERIAHAIPRARFAHVPVSFSADGASQVLDFISH